MKIDFYKKNGEKDVAVEYPKNLVSEVSDSRLLEYIRMFRANKRSNTAVVKDRSEVSGGGKKPWKQKGTGRARAGSSRSPIWVGGGVTFGPTNERNYQIKLNKKEKRAAILSVVSSKVKEKSALGISDLKISEPKTSVASNVLANLPLKGKVVIFLPKEDIIWQKSFRNISAVNFATAYNIDPISIISADNIIFTKESLAELERHFSPKVIEKEAKNG